MSVSVSSSWQHLSERNSAKEFLSQGAADAFDGNMKKTVASKCLHELDNTSNDNKQLVENVWDLLQDIVCNITHYCFFIKEWWSLLLQK